MSNDQPAKTSPANAGVLRQTPRPADADPTLLRLAAARLAIEGISHQVDGGRFAAKVVAGQADLFQADIFSDGHDIIAAALLWRPVGQDGFSEVPMTFVINDRWQASHVFDAPGEHQIAFAAWRDLFATWRKEILAKHAAGQSISLELTEGRRLIEAATGPKGRATAEDKTALEAVLAQDDALAAQGYAARLTALTDDQVTELMIRARPART